MAGKHDNGVEFELMDVEIPLYDPTGDLPGDQDGLVRDSYRVEPLVPDEAAAFVGEREFPLLDIGANGAALLAAPGDGFTADGRAVVLRLRLLETSLTVVAKPVHVTPLRGKGLRIGLAFTDLSPEAREAVARYNARVRKKIFNGDDPGARHR